LVTGSFWFLPATVIHLDEGTYTPILQMEASHSSWVKSGLVSIRWYLPSQEFLFPRPPDYDVSHAQPLADTLLRPKKFHPDPATAGESWKEFV
jgi:hypothetical protein